MVKHVNHSDITKTIKQLSKARVTVGFFETATYEDGTPIAGVAAVNEYGSENMGIPARPFFRPATQDNEQKHAELLAQATRDAFSGGDLSQGLEVLGQVVVGDIKDAIVAVTEPALKDSTIAARARRHSEGKASDEPLVDTSQMLNAVDYLVEVS